jgi:large subunit ribosomal protein L17
VAEKLVTLGKRGQAALAAATSAADDKAKAKAIAENVHCRRLAAAKLRQHARTLFHGTPTVKGKTLREAWHDKDDFVHQLFDRIAPVFKERPGGYTRIVKLGQRPGDSAEMAIIEWVETPIEGAAAVAAPQAS